MILLNSQTRSSNELSGIAKIQASLPMRVAGRYELRQVLGRGGFGIVFAAYDELTKRDVALKLIRSDVFNKSTESRKSTISTPLNAMLNDTGITPAERSIFALKDEFRVLTQLHHPNLASVYDFGHVEGGVYFTQELITGQSLGDYLGKKNRHVIVEIFLQLASVLDYIHTLGFVHEDIKPTNLLVICEGQYRSTLDCPQAKLIDFGLARMLRTPESSTNFPDTPENVFVLGTPGFSAPEKVQGKCTDHRSDIYSLASTLYTAICGHRPFPSRDFQEALKSQQNWRPELAGVLLPTCGFVIADLIGRMLEYDPERRPQSARSIVLELLRRESFTQLRSQPTHRQEHSNFARILVAHFPFVDRDHLLHDLLHRFTTIATSTTSEALDATRVHGRSCLARTIVLEGPEGMGKKRLLRELQREIQLADGLFVQSNHWHHGGYGLSAFEPVILQLAAALGEQSDRLLPYAELIGKVRENKLEQTEISQLIDFFVVCAEHRPFVLCLSEIENSSDLFRLVFEQLVRMLEHHQARILVCATVTSQSSQGKLQAMYTSLEHNGFLERKKLKPFLREEIQAVLRGTLGEIAALSDLTKLLMKLTGGHPLRLRETLRLLIEESVLVRDGGTWILRSSPMTNQQLHKTLAQRCTYRLERMQQAVWDVVRVLYVMEVPLCEQLLQRLCELSEASYWHILEDLEAEGLISRHVGAESNLVSLAHDAVREAIRNRFQGSFKQIQCNLAERIEIINASIRDARLEFLRICLLDDSADGLACASQLEATAEYLLSVDQPQLAAQVLERMIVRLRREGGTEHMPWLLRIQLLLLERAPGVFEDVRREMSHYEAGVLVAELLGNYRAQALFWLGLADRHTMIEKSQYAETVLCRLDQAAQAAQYAGDQLLELRVANRRAEVLLGLGEVQQALECTQQAMTLLDLPEAKDVHICQVSGMRLRCLATAGKFEEAKKLHDATKGLAASVSVLQRQTYLSGIAFLAAFSREPERAIEEIEVAIQQLRNANTSRLLVSLLHNLGDLRLRLNQLEEAKTAFEEAYEICFLHGYYSHMHFNRGFLGYVLVRMDKVEEGAAMLAEAKVALHQCCHEKLLSHQLRILDAQVAYLMGQGAYARRELEEMLADLRLSNEVSLARWTEDVLSLIERDMGTNFITLVEPAKPQYSDPSADTVRAQPVSAPAQTPASAHLP